MRDDMNATPQTPPREERPAPRWPAPAVLVLRAAAVLALVAVAFAALDGGWPDAFGAGRLALAVVAAFVLMTSTVLVAGWRLAVLAGKPVSPHDGMAVNMIAQLVVLLVPSRLSEAAKPVGLNLRCGLPMAGGFAVLVVERLLDTIFLAVLALCAVAVSVGPYSGSMRSSATILAGLGVAGIVCLAVAARRPALLRRAAAVTGSRWVERQAAQAADALARLAAPRVAVPAIGLSAISWLLSYMIFLAIIRIVGVGDLGAGAILVVFVASTLGLVISVAPGGLGTFEGAIVLALGAFGVPVATAVATALLIRLCLALPVVAGGVWFLSAGGESLWTLIRRLKQPGAAP